MTTDEVEPNTAVKSEQPSGPRTIDPSDPVVIRRERIKRLCDLGSKVGYGCFGLAIVLFFIALLTGFPSALVSIVIVAMLIGSVVLLPAIVLGYGVKAADAEDRGQKFGY